MITPEAYTAWRAQRPDLRLVEAQGLTVSHETRPSGGVIVVSYAGLGRLNPTHTPD